MNLLFLTHQGGIAGSTYSIYYLADGLAKKGHQVYVGCNPASLLSELLNDSPAQAIPMVIRSKIDYRNIRDIYDVVKTYKIDIINAQSGRDRYTSLFARLLYSLDVPVLHTRRQTPKSTGFFLQNWFYTKHTRHIIAVSDGVKKELVGLGIPAGHITVIHNGTPSAKYKLTELKKIDDLRARYDITPADTVIGCVSRPKRQEQLLEALRYIEHPLKVIFVGIHENDKYREITNSYADRHKIIYTGNVPPDEVLYFYKLFRIKVLASVTEGLSQALLEALAMGVPVIATAAAGNLDLIQDGENGLLYEDGNIRELAGKIEILLNDYKLRNRLISRGESTALKDFNIERTITNYESFFKRIVKEAGLKQASAASVT